MDDEFSLLELRIIQNMISKKSHQEIADVVYRPVDVVTEYILKFSKNRSVVTHQQRLDEKENKKRMRAANKLKAKKQKQLANIQSRQEKSVILSVDDERMRRRKALEQKKFATREVELSKLISVQVDHKTIIYIKPGENPDEAKRKYMQRVNASRNYNIEKHKVLKEVKKFKPV